MEDCTRQLMNTAASECPQQMDIIKVPILFDDKAVVEYTGTTDAALTTWIQNQIHAATKLNRGFPFPASFAIDDTNEEPKFVTSNIGVKVYAGEGAKGFNITSIQDMQLLPKLASANGLTVKALLVDQKKQVWGLKSTGGYIPFEAMATTYNGKHKTADDIPSMMTSFDYVNPDDYNNLVLLGTLTASISSLKGLADVTLENVGTATAPVIKLFIDGTDITSRYSTLLAVKEAWLVKGATPTGNPVYDSAQVGFKTWGVTAAADVIQLVDPALLHALAAPVNNIEGTPLTL